MTVFLVPIAILICIKCHRSCFDKVVIEKFVKMRVKSSYDMDRNWKMIDVIYQRINMYNILVCNYNVILCFVIFEYL